MNQRSAETKPNEAKWVKARIMNEMYEKFIKRSQTSYHACFQVVAAILDAFFGKNECFPPMNQDWQNEAKRSQVG
jgi:hypothetical protein